jgi:hypothetical protein
MPPMEELLADKVESLFPAFSVRRHQSLRINGSCRAIRLRSASWADNPMSEEQSQCGVSLEPAACAESSCVATGFSCLEHCDSP